MNKSMENGIDNRAAGGAEKCMELCAAVAAGDAAEKGVALAGGKRVSVVITAYNVEPWIRQSVESALQECVDEVVVVADKPTDGTLDAIKDIADERLVVIHNAVNMGAGMSRRIGTQYASGEYVLLLDGDDWIEPGFVKALYERAVETDADVVSGGIKILEEDGTWKAESYGNCTTLGYDKISRFWGERIVFMNNKIIRRRMYELVPYCHRRFIEDTPTIVPILWHANRVEYVDTVGYTYRMRSSSLTHTSSVAKDVIYKGLCWVDLVDFFYKHDEEVFKHIALKDYVKNIIAVLHYFENLKPEDIAPYKDEWVEFTHRLFCTIGITGISFKADEKKKGERGNGGKRIT